jgi:hypothetical protein
MRRQIHWVFVVAAFFALAYEALAWAGAVKMPDVGSSIRRSIHSEAPIATFYAAMGEMLRAVPALRDYSDATASAALEILDGRIVDQPQLASELIFGQTTTPAHGRLKWFYYVPWALLVIAGWLFSTRPGKVHLVPRRR